MLQSVVNVEILQNKCMQFAMIITQIYTLVIDKIKHLEYIERFSHKYCL